MAVLERKYFSMRLQCHLEISDRILRAEVLETAEEEDKNCWA